MPTRLVVLALLPGCAVLSGAVVPTGAAPGADAGVELHALAAVPLERAGGGAPSVAGITYRQLGDARTTAVSAGWLVAAPAGRATLFARLTVDLLARERTPATTLTHALSPTVELGVAPLGRGACASVAAGWDVRIGEPDRALLGAYFGWCGLLRDGDLR